MCMCTLLQVHDQQEAEKKKATSQEIKEALYVQNKKISEKKEVVLTDLSKVEPAVREAQQGTVLCIVYHSAYVHVSRFVILSPNIKGNEHSISICDIPGYIMSKRPVRLLTQFQTNSNNEVNLGPDMIEFIGISWWRPLH